ncbi:hypothetical protein CC86DRAFT_169784 [Ophiobolus disseminans]|uniref:Uncharacterized protein n=1 Tax=Ophiobolus disseminans TaxID=1469910 RepID=A0A6A6ZAY8_9PLEO|nr:hypothetical protein CC86DRAFT_169784 [Ophiobolus disseminans]
MAEIYDTDRFGVLYYASRQPTSTHLLLAANHLAQVCESAGISHAFLGGWTVRLRGGTRETQDVDITVATTMELFKKATLQMPRICFPQTHGQTAVNLFVHTGKSWDQGYKDLPDLAVQVDVIISGQLNSPTEINDNTSEVVTLPNGIKAVVVNTFYLLRGKFHAFNTRGDTNTNDYQDLVFLITKYPKVMSQHGRDIEEAYRLAFLRKYAETNAANQNFIEWMRQTLGLMKVDTENEEEEVSSDRVWDETYQRYKKQVGGNWQWVPLQQQTSQPEASGSAWTWDETHQRYRQYVNGQWVWAPS